LIGLVEEEWLATLATIDKEDVIYSDYVSEGRRLAKYLKDKA
jgi:5' nucleotidase, putative (fragment)